MEIKMSLEKFENIDVFFEGFLFYFERNPRGSD